MIIKEAVFHLNTEEYIYPISRRQLVVRIRTARENIKQCKMVYWDRTKPTDKREAVLQCCQREKLFDYFEGDVFFSKIARYQKYYFLLEDKEGKEWYFSTWGVTDATPSEGAFEYLYANEGDIVKVPQWAKGVIFYQIFPERFWNGDFDNDPEGCVPWGSKPTRENYMGGDLKGILDKLPYLHQLGVECIYLNPIFEGDFNHKYATTDYFKIDPAFGNEAILKRLVQECHIYGIRIILDGVFNHTGIHFKPFLDILEKQKNSAYRNWYYIAHFPVQVTHYDYECVGAYKWMPKLNSSNAEVRRFIIRVMDYWIEKFGIDGWRLDVADEVDYTVWQEANRFLKEKYPDILLIGETWGYGGKMLRGDQMDSVMNYMFRDAVRDYFGQEKIQASEFDSRLNHMLALHKRETNLLMYNLIDSHDTERFLYYCDGNKKKLKLAAAFQFLFPGSPAVYYGDEAGMTGGNDPECRGTMVFSEEADEELLDWYRKLCTFRKEYSCLRKGAYRTICVEDKENIFGFVRFTDQEILYLLFHNEEKETTIICPVLKKGTYINLLTNESYSGKAIENGRLFFNEDILEYKGEIEVRLPAYSILVISKQKEEKEYDEEK